jgi:hypothetical protein
LVWWVSSANLPRGKSDLGFPISYPYGNIGTVGFTVSRGFLGCWVSTAKPYGNIGAVGFTVSRGFLGCWVSTAKPCGNTGASGFHLCKIFQWLEVWWVSPVKVLTQWHTMKTSVVARHSLDVD